MQAVQPTGLWIYADCSPDSFELEFKVLDFQSKYWILQSKYWIFNQSIGYSIKVLDFQSKYWNLDNLLDNISNYLLDNILNNMLDNLLENILAAVKKSLGHLHFALRRQCLLLIMFVLCVS